MFKYLPLLWANLGRKKLRTGLTLASIIVAFLLFGLMQTLRVALTGNPDLAGVDRLVTIHKIAIIQPLPESYLNRIRGGRWRQGGDCSHDWFGGVYQDDRNQIAGDRRRRADVLPGVRRILAAARAEGRVAQGPHRRRSSARWSRERFGWKVGDTIPMRSNIWVQKDGGNVWPMKVVGIYDAGNGDNQSLYFHHEYLDESRGGGVQGHDRLGGHARAGSGALGATSRATIDAHVRQLLDRDQDRDREGVHPGLRQPDGQHRRAADGDRRSGVLHDAAGHGEHDGAVDPRAPQRDRRDEDARLLERQRHRRWCSAKRCW